MNDRKERRRQLERDARVDAAFQELRARVTNLEARVLKLQHTVVDLSAGPVHTKRVRIR